MSALHAGDALRGLLIHVAKHVSGNPPHLDFLCAFGDAVATVVAIDVLERFVAAVANATCTCMARSADSQHNRLAQ